MRVLRAAQFHELVAQLVDWGARGEVAYVPRMRTQLVAARAVAEVLADLATAPGPGVGPLSEIASPREESLIEMAALLAARRGYPSKIEGVSDPADPDRELNENGALLPSPGGHPHRPHLRRLARLGALTGRTTRTARARSPLATVPAQTDTQWASRAVFPEPGRPAHQDQPPGQPVLQRMHRSRARHEPRLRAGGRCS